MSRKREKGTPSRITISHAHSSDDPYVEILIEDESSGVVAANIKIASAELMRALGSLAYRPCVVEWGAIDKVGMVREHKEEFVPFKLDFSSKPNRDADAIAALAPFETDGWTARQGDLGNMHRYKKQDGKTGFVVSFSRFVPAKTSETDRG